MSQRRMLISCDYWDGNKYKPLQTICCFIHKHEKPHEVFSRVIKDYLIDYLFIVISTEILEHDELTEEEQLQKEFNLEPIEYIMV